MTVVFQADADLMGLRTCRIRGASARSGHSMNQPSTRHPGIWVPSSYGLGSPTATSASRYRPSMASGLRTPRANRMQTNQSGSTVRNRHPPAVGDTVEHDSSPFDTDHQLPSEFITQRSQVKILSPRRRKRSSGEGSRRDPFLVPRRATWENDEQATSGGRRFKAGRPPRPLR